MLPRPPRSSFFFFNDTATTEIYTLSLHALFRSERTVIYTSPLKALSNTKFTEFTRLFGADRVGILTGDRRDNPRSEEHTSELQSRLHLVCRLLLEKKNNDTLRATHQSTAYEVHN